jgi:hypothetical protein
LCPDKGIPNGKHLRCFYWSFIRAILQGTNIAIVQKESTFENPKNPDSVSAYCVMSVVFFPSRLILDRQIIEVALLPVGTGAKADSSNR